MQGGVIKAGEGVDGVKWFELTEIPDVLVECHKPLYDILKLHS